MIRYGLAGVAFFLVCSARLLAIDYGSYSWPALGGGSGGISSLNGLTVPIQTFAVGTAGNNFNIVSASSVHTFNAPTASAINRGLLSPADWSIFNAKQNSLTFGNLTAAGTDGIVITGGTGSIIGSGTSLSQHVSDSTHNGYLSSGDWTNFNSKQAALSFGSISSSTTGVTVGNGTSSTVGPNVTLDVQTASGSQPGLISSADWTTFNGKADLASPAFTGVPTAPTASVGTSTTQLATTAFVLSQGFQGATGSMPNASSATLVSTTSATTSFVTAITTTITVTASSAPILTKCVLDMTSATAASVANMRITVNAVASGTVSESLTTATTQHLTVPNQYLSASLGPGTYTVNCDFARASGTGTVTVGQGSLTAVALQGTESNGISQLTGLGLSAGPGSGLQSITGTLTLAGGGTNASLVAANGAIPYSTASAIALLAAGTTGQVLRSGGAGAPTWTAETFPASTTINQILYSSAANVISGLATANTGALVTSSTGVPSIASGATANRLLRTNGTTVSFGQAVLTSDVTGTLPAANGGTGVTAFASQRVPFGTGTSLTTDPVFIYDTTNTTLSVGGSGTAKINAINASGSHTALQAYNSSAGNAFQAVNVSAYTAALISRQNNATTGASIGMEFGRGTAASPTGALNGDQIGVIGATPDAASGNAFGYSGAMSFVATEDATTTATGGEIVLAATPNTTVVPIERFRIKQSGQTTLVNSHLKSTQTSPPTAAPQASAGTGATCTLARATDKAGEITVTTGTLGLSTGSYCRVSFLKAYDIVPICTLTPASSTLSTSVYVSQTVNDMDINFAVAGGISSTYVINYHCEETQ